MAARPFPAVSGARGETSVAFTTDLFVAVIFRGQHFQGGLNDSTTETVSRQPSVFETGGPNGRSRAHRRTR